MAPCSLPRLMSRLVGSDLFGDFQRNMQLSAAIDRLSDRLSRIHLTLEPVKSVQKSFLALSFLDSRDRTSDSETLIVTGGRISATYI